jgi:hypothetical protein
MYTSVDVYPSVKANIAEQNVVNMSQNFNGVRNEHGEEEEWCTVKPLH